MKIIRKNPSYTSKLWVRIFKYSSILEVMSNIVGHMKVPFKKSKINKSVRGVFRHIECLVHNSSKFNFKVKTERWGWREGRKYFCSYAKQIIPLLDSKKKGGIDYSKYKCKAVQNKTGVLIADKDLHKTIKVYLSSLNLVDKLSSFHIRKCNKYINLTKEFLCDSVFLKFAYYIMRNKRIIQEGLNCINDEWFKKTAELIKISQYEFKPAKYTGGCFFKTDMRILVVTNNRDKVVQEAMSILLEMIYEGKKCFQDESHGFRPNKGYHTAFQEIKYKWSGVPYYIESGIVKAFDDIHRNVLINILNEKISDKRFTDLICAMYKVNILCLQGF